MLTIIFNSLRSQGASYFVFSPGPLKLSIALAGAFLNAMPALSFLLSLSLPYGGSSGEKRFTMLKRVKKKSELRSTMSH